jgi:hypothetical protein
VQALLQNSGNMNLMRFLSVAGHFPETWATIDWNSSKDHTEGKVLRDMTESDVLCLSS